MVSFRVMTCFTFSQESSFLHCNEGEPLLTATLEDTFIREPDGIAALPPDNEAVPPAQSSPMKAVIGLDGSVFVRLGAADENPRRTAHVFFTEGDPRPPMGTDDEDVAKQTPLPPFQSDRVSRFGRRPRLKS